MLNLYTESSLVKKNGSKAFPRESNFRFNKNIFYRFKGSFLKFCFLLTNFNKDFFLKFYYKLFSSYYLTADKNLFFQPTSEKKLICDKS